MTYTELIGFAAAFCTTISFLPQAIKVLKTKDTSSLSLSMYLVFTVGVALWLIYGLFQGDKAIVVANLITFCLAALILYYTLVNSLKAKKSRN